jgi:hypothetical protein
MVHKLINSSSFISNISPSALDLFFLVILLYSALSSERISLN